MRRLVCNDCREDKIENEQAREQSENLEVIGIEHVEVRGLFGQGWGLEGHEQSVEVVVRAQGGVLQFQFDRAYCY